MSEKKKLEEVNGREKNEWTIYKVMHMEFGKIKITLDWSH